MIKRNANNARKHSSQVLPNFLSPALLTILIATCLALSGCGRKQAQAPPPTQGTPNGEQPAPTSAAANPVNPADPPEAQEKARVAQAVAMRSGIAPPAPAMALRGGEEATPEVLKAYNQQLAQLVFQRRDAPETLDELVRKWPMPRLPVAPRGKQIVYDAKNRTIILYPP
jgi:hypothetical protein